MAKDGLKIVDGEDEEQDGEKKGEEKAVKFVTRRVSFADLKRATKKPVMEAILIVRPEELGKDPVDLGVTPGDTIGLVVRPLNAGEDAEIREIVKDFADGPEWIKEYYEEIALRCLVEPSLPNSAEGRAELQKWQPGTVSWVARTAQNQAGMGDHVVKNAKDELGKLVAVTTDGTSSTSASARNIA